MPSENDSIAGATLELLEARLDRLEFLLTGKTEWNGRPIPTPKLESSNDTVDCRLASLENKLEILTREQPIVRDTLQLCKLFSTFLNGLIMRMLLAEDSV